MAVIATCCVCGDTTTRYAQFYFGSVCATCCHEADRSARLGDDELAVGARILAAGVPGVVARRWRVGRPGVHVEMVRRVPEARRWRDR